MDIYLASMYIILCIYMCVCECIMYVHDIKSTYGAPMDCKHSTCNTDSYMCVCVDIRLK